VATNSVWDANAAFSTLPTHSLTAKELSKALEKLLVSNFHVLPVEMTIRDMFEIGVKRGWIKEDAAGKLLVNTRSCHER
jgi:hypothetical protein